MEEIREYIKIESDEVYEVNSEQKSYTHNSKNRKRKNSSDYCQLHGEVNFSQKRIENYNLM